MLIGADSKLLFIGDSITDCGRASPVGEGLFGALGNGYVQLVDAHIQAIYPRHRIRTINMGTSGNTSRDLEDRWEDDVLLKQPDWVSIMIGINDIWRQFDSPAQREWHVSADDYQATLERLVDVTLERVEGLVLMKPFVLEPNLDDPMRAMVDRYGEIMRRLTDDAECTLVDTQAVFDELMSHHHATYIGWDRVHVNPIGHLAMARAWLSAVGADLAASG